MLVCLLKPGMIHGEIHHPTIQGGAVTVNSVDVNGTRISRGLIDATGLSLGVSTSSVITGYALYVDSTNGRVSIGFPPNVASVPLEVFGDIWAWQGNLFASNKLNVGDANFDNTVTIRVAEPVIVASATTGTLSASMSFRNGSGNTSICQEPNAGSGCLTGSQGNSTSIYNSNQNRINFGTNDSIRMTISGTDAYIGIGNVNPSTSVHVSSGVIMVDGTGGGLRLTNGATQGGLITGIFASSASLNFPTVAGATCSDLTVTVSGALDGDACFPGFAAASVVTGLQYFCFVSSANTVTLRACCHNGESGGVAQDCANPDAGTAKIVLFRF